MERVGHTRHRHFSTWRTTVPRCRSQEPSASANPPDANAIPASDLMTTSALPPIARFNLHTHRPPPDCQDHDSSIRCALAIGAGFHTRAGPIGKIHNLISGSIGTTLSFPARRHQIISSSELTIREHSLWGSRTTTHETSRQQRCY